MIILYYKFSDYLKNKYGCKTYKLPVNIKVTCPNRDGNISSLGCIFCGEEGAGFECLNENIPITEQLIKNMDYIKNKYNAEMFIAYFQNYSNTYLKLDEFKEYINLACIDGICAIYISTRPDCINNEYIEFLSEIKKTKNIDIIIELGLQTVNYKTLKALNRGHGLSEFIDSVLTLKKYDIECCAHYIVDLPMDDIEDVIEGAKILSALKVEQVKCHSLYILKNTILGDMYLKGDIKPVSQEEYVERVITFLEYLSPNIVIQRLLGRAPEERTLFCSWETSWWKIRDKVEEKMQKEGRYQGRLFNYLNGASINKLYEE